MFGKEVLKVIQGEKRAFSLVELLVVISIFSVLLSLLMPMLEKSTFFAKTLECKNNLKSQGTAYMLYAEDFHDYYPGMARDGSGKADIYDYRYGDGLPKVMEGYVEGSEELEAKEGSNAGHLWAKYSPMFRCPLGYDLQGHKNERYRIGKAFYGLFFHAGAPFSSRNGDPDDPRRMKRMGDTWTWDLVTDSSSTPGERGLRFNVVAMDHNKYEAWTLHSNHFWDAPDLEANDHWHEKRVAHKSRFGEGVFNFLLDDGSVLLHRARRPDIRKEGPEGWNVRNPSGVGTDRWMLPRELAVEY